jgi:serine/threonine protein kinase
MLQKTVDKKDYSIMNNEKNIFSDTYEIIGYLQSGSGGAVYKAYHKRLKKEVVLKRIKQKNVNMRINRQEVDILKNLNHSYLPQVLDFLNVDGEIYTVMSFIPGHSFKELLEEGVHFTQNQLIRWGMQLCSALYYLHSQNPPIVHGDIKPANIMLTPQGNICLIDFNISFFMDENTVLGYTEGYTSPEQYIIALDKKSIHAIPNHTVVDEKSDIYSVGATFYHLITGHKLERRRSGREYEELQEHVSEGLASVIMKAIVLERDKRYANAYEMYQAFQNICKKDKRYQRLLTRERAIRAGLILLLGISIAGTGYGIHEVKLERVEKYNNLVEKQVIYREAGKYGKERKVYKSAIKVFPDKLESYYQNAYTLYDEEKYEKCIDFVEYDVLQNEKADIIDERMGDLYYLEAESYFQLEDYKNSVDIFEKAFQFGAKDSLYYRDYAIALAYNGNTEKAEEILQDAIDKGLNEDSIHFTKGEIEKALNNESDAISEFRQCIGITKDDQLKTRAYLLLSEIYEEAGEDKEERAILLEARNNLPMENQMQILEKLIQVDINLDDDGDTQLRNEAINLSKEVIEQGWETYTTYNNLAILYQKQKNLAETADILTQMIELYGDDYNIEKRLAFLEIDKQEQKGNDFRDYSAFEKYYERAEKLYYAQLKSNDTDSEMQLLENVYQQVRSGGWL